MNLYNLKNQEICPACKSCKVVPLEKISTLNIANAWSKVEPEAGQTLLNYLSKGIIPSTIKIDKCCLCGLEFGNPMFAVDDAWYSKFEKYGIRWEFSQCLKDLPSNCSTILEIGCGEGYFLEFANNNGHKSIGIDFNDRAIQLAKQKGLEAYLCNIKNLNRYSNIKFDSAIFFHVIEHLDDLENFFDNIAKIMPIGSTLHFSCPSPRRFTTHLEREKKAGLRDVWDYPPFHQSRWNREAAHKLLARFGWHLQKYIEEPFHWRGVSSLLISNQLAVNKLQLSDLPPVKRKKLILRKMIQTLIPSLKYSGMSMYCYAIRRSL